MRDVACNEFTGSLAVIMPDEDGGWAARVSMYDIWPAKRHTTIHEAIEWRDELIRADAQAAIAAEGRAALYCDCDHCRALRNSTVIPYEDDVLAHIEFQDELAQIMTRTAAARSAVARRVRERDPFRWELDRHEAGMRPAHRSYAK